MTPERLAEIRADWTDSERTMGGAVREVILELLAEVERVSAERDRERQARLDRMDATVYERIAWLHDIGKHKDSEHPHNCARCEMEHPLGRFAQVSAERDVWMRRATVAERLAWVATWAGPGDELDGDNAVEYWTTEREEALRLHDEAVAS